MMDAECLQDAITILPEELLAPVDALRQQKRDFWKPIAAVAASLLLVVGLYHLQPLQKTAENGAFLEDAAEGAQVEDHRGSHAEYSTNLAAYSLTAKVKKTEKDHLVVSLPNGETAKVFFDNLEELKELSPGAEITLCFDQKPKDLKQLYPNGIFIK